MKQMVIDYNPYTNRFSFNNADGSDASIGTSFSGLTVREHAFTHRLDDLVEKLKEAKITDVDCKMLKRDFLLFEKKASQSKIHATLVEEYSSSEDTMKIIQNSYDQIKKSYDGYYEIIDDSGDSKIKAIQTNKQEIANLINDYTEVVADVIRLAFVSEYSGGKSYLINSIIGKKLLKESPNPTTQFIHELSYSKSISLVYEYADGTKSERPVKNYEELREELALVTDLNYLLTKNLRIVHVEYPFETSELKIHGKYKIVFCDTPGPSAKGYDTEKLYDFFDEQRDTLPIFVLKKDSIVTSGNKGIFQNMNEGNFATAYRFVFMNQCDTLNSLQLPCLDPQQKDNFIDIINESFSNPTIIFGSARWYLDEKCNNAGDNNPDIADYHKLLKYEVNKYNRLYEGENLDDPCGVGILENQINLYIKNHAEYQKCLKARKYLTSVCDYSTDLYKDLIEEEKKRKKVKINEFNNKIDQKTLTSSEAIVDSICKNQKDQIDETIKIIDKELKALYNWFNKKTKEEQQKKKEQIFSEYNAQLLNCIAKQKERLKDEAITKLNDILNLIEKDGSVPIKEIDDIKKLISKSNNEIRALSEGANANIFKNTIALKFFAKHEMSDLLKEDKKNNKLKGILREKIEDSVNGFYEGLSHLYEECKKDIKSKLKNISLIIKGITKEIERIDNYNKVICDVKQELDTCFLKQRR